MRSLTILPTLLAFALAGLGAILAAGLMVTRIETTSEREIEHLFLAERLDWAVVSVDGLQVRLTGTAPDEATRFQALTAAGSVVDATHVIDAMQVDPGKVVEPPKFSVEILRNDEGVSVIGLAPNTLDRDAVTSRLDRIAGEGDVTDFLETADYPVPDGWAEALEYGLEALAQLPRSKISVAPGRVNITAISDSAEQRRTLIAALRNAIPEGIEVALDISAPRPVITPFTLRFLIDADGPRFDACSANTEAGRTRILAAAAEVGLKGTAECRIGLGVPSPRWPDAVTEAIRAVGRLGGGTLTISDADISLIAPAGTPPRDFDTVVGELEAALPEVFSLHALLQAETPQNAPEGADEALATPEFVATLSAEGVLQLRGRVPDERLRSAVEGFARARFSTAEVSAAMRVADGLPSGWAGRVFAGLESMVHLTNGTLVVQPDLLEVKGDTHDPDAKAEIAQILGEQLGSTEKFVIDVTYIEVVEEVDLLPTPLECVGAINAVLGDQKITFSPGSADIDGSARVTIDRIAEIMQDCTAVPMEIAGHTDSQGRESMNLGLSQRRAEAVLEALMARRVLVANLTARGYGEQIPVADNDTEEGREANRRIEFTLRLRVSTPGEDDQSEVTAEADGDAGDPEAGGEETVTPEERPEARPEEPLEEVPVEEPSDEVPDGSGDVIDDGSGDGSGDGDGPAGAENSEGEPDE